MNLQHLLLTAGWILYCALHSMLASLWLKQKMQVMMGQHFRYYRLYYTVFAFLSLALVVGWQIILPSPMVFEPRLLSQAAGVLIGLAGIGIMAICIRKYFMHLSGLKSLYLNDELAANQLQVTGIHRYVRHPLYSGTFMALWGFWIFYPRLSLLLANLVITGYTVLAIRWEEQKLVAEFGDSYRRYQKQVPRLIPLPGKTAGNIG